MSPCSSVPYRYLVRLFLLFFSAPVFATTIVGPTSYSSAVAKAEPGSVIKLKPGTYPRGLQIVNLNGTPTKPIVIEALNPSRPPYFIARQRKNTVSIANASYVTLRNLLFDGRNFSVDAVKAEGWANYAHHITLEGLRIVRHGAYQSTVGISSKCPAWGWVIRGNVIIRAGTGMYLGDSDGSAPFFAGLIEHNLVYDSRGYNLQIKHQHSRPAGIAIPPGAQTTIIRHNVFSKFGNGATGNNARPNVLVGHFPPEGNGANDRYAIYGNFFYANPTEALFQGEGNIAMYSNAFVNFFGNAVHIQPHNDVPKNIWLFHNTIIADGAGIELRGMSNDYLRLLAANAVFATRTGTRHLQTGNLVLPLSSAKDYLINPSAPPGRIDLRPRSAMAGADKATFAMTESFPDAGYDFDGIAFGKHDAGAYALTNNGTPKWPLSLTIKPPLNQAGKE